MQVSRQGIELLVSCLRRLGWQLSRYRPLRTGPGRLAATLAANRIDIVLDVGANRGQFAREIRSFGYAGRIVSFEPLRQCHEDLVRQAATDPAWVVAPRMALSDLEAMSIINVAENEVSSSLLEMESIHRDAEPRSKYVRREEVETNRLDLIAPRFLDADSRCLLKIDAQGAEAKIIEGAKDLMKRLIGLKVELSLERLYRGESDGMALIQTLRGQGFELWALEPGFIDPRTGRMLQADGVFYRSGQ